MSLLCDAGDLSTRWSLFQKALIWRVPANTQVVPRDSPGESFWGVVVPACLALSLGECPGFLVDRAADSGIFRPCICPVLWEGMYVPCSDHVAWTLLFLLKLSDGFSHPNNLYKALHFPFFSGFLLFFFFFYPPDHLPWAVKLGRVRWMVSSRCDGRAFHWGSASI